MTQQNSIAEKATANLKASKTEKDSDKNNKNKPRILKLCM